MALFVLWLPAASSAIDFRLPWTFRHPPLTGFNMSDLSAFPITRKWAARHPDRLQLYSLPTPNGVKVSIMLEEIGLAYEPHLVTSARTRAGRRSSCRSTPTARSP